MSHETTKRIVEWEEVDFVWQVSGEQDIVLVVDAADTRGGNDSSRRHASKKRS
ncbi:hypothetical protein HAPAU_36890 [Halalkalicoccus paucihalophilus]|uniref:Transcription regulator AsnC/Lrp ligand binding domain-containing protein n=1 Tax=Halalkalicoccus paucihalophilus TaxID=1008153 RepID=A0A151A937_9EURY|nr:hypothetical protein HAPAU_36890 [Halalkalicoccus paucihalophilus]